MKKQEVEMVTVTAPFSELQLFTLLLDSLFYYKTGRHTAPNFGWMKDQVCKLSGHGPKTNNTTLIKLIGTIYIDNGMGQKYRDLCAKYNFPI
jgi:hypothetical protein